MKKYSEILYKKLNFDLYPRAPLNYNFAIKMMSSQRITPVGDSIDSSIRLNLKYRYATTTNALEYIPYIDHYFESDSEGRKEMKLYNK